MVSRDSFLVEYHGEGDCYVPKKCQEVSGRFDVVTFPWSCYISRITTILSIGTECVSAGLSGVASAKTPATTLTGLINLIVFCLLITIKVHQRSFWYHFNQCSR